MTLNLVQLATLREFARRGTLAAAAEALGYTPGAASQHVAGLERELGTPLLTGAGRHVVLTDAGRVLADHAERLLAAEDAARRAVQGLGDDVAGAVSLGIWGSSAAALMAPLWNLANSTYPALTVTSREVSVDTAAAAVRARDVDLAFGLDYPDAPMPRNPDTIVTPLLRETFWIAAPPRSPGSARPEDPAEPRGSAPPGDSPGPRGSARPERSAWSGEPADAGADLSDLADHPWILPSEATVMGRAVHAAFRRAGAEANVVHEVTDSTLSLQMVSQGLGLTLATDLMSRLAHDPPVRALTRERTLSRDVVIVTPVGTGTHRSVLAVADLATQVVAAVREAG